MALVTGLSVITSAFAQEQHKKNNSAEASPAAAKGKLVPITEKETAWAAKARAAYPLKVCLASDEKFDGAEKPAEFIYRETGKPDRLVMFCCEGCGDDFMKDPAMYLAKLDAATQAKAGKKAHKANHD
jgi:hypothetical protein